MKMRSPASISSSSWSPKSMKRRRFLTWAATVAWLLGLFSPLYSSLKQDDAPLSPSFIRELQNLPYGIAKQRCLILRYKHVGSIQFYGSASNSDFSFQRGHSIIPEGLSLKLKNSGKFSWASGVIKFKQPINVTRYNSLILWVRTTHPGLKFWLGVQDPSWKQPEIYQARTDILPVRGFPVNHAVQLVVPFNVIYEEVPVNYAALNQIAFEFGEDTVGNFKQGNIEILGIAFVRQTRGLNKVKLVVKEVVALPPPTVVSEPQATVVVPPLDPGSAQVLTPEPVRGLEPESRDGATLSQVVNLEDQQTADMFSQYGFEMRRPMEPVLPKAKDESWFSVLRGMISDWTQPYARKWPLDESDMSASEKDLRTPAERKRTKIIVATSVAGGVALLGTLGLWWYFRGRQKIHHLGRLGKVLHEVHWLFSQSDLPASHRYEDDFWKGLSAKNMRHAWLSTTGASVIRSPEDQFYGEEFLMRQIRRANENGIHLFPSISFVRTTFNYETFLTNPTLFHLRRVSPEDYQLNDDELRAKEKDCFPIWIPPFWQKKFRLPNRVLVEYGKSIGVPHSRDSVEFNRTSSALRKLAIQIIEKFTEVSPGVRIENATWLLNSKIWGRSPAAHTQLPEFWSDVISAIKAKHPEFMFLADGVGEEVKTILNLGFDYFEDDYFMETLVRQIRMGHVGNLPHMLGGEWGNLLKNAIFNITRLLRPLPSSEIIQRQNMLGAILLTLLPGVIQHDDNLTEELHRFIKWTSNSTVFRKGKFSVLRTNQPTILAFARWRRQSLYVAIANISIEAQDAQVKLEPVLEGIDQNKLYLFNNALHGASPLKSILDQSTPANGPALALWGQNLRDTGIPIRIPPLSLKLFTVTLTRAITGAFVKEPIAPAKTVR